MEEGQSCEQTQRENMSEEDLFAVDSLEAVESNQRVETGVGLDLSRKSPAGGRTGRLQQSSPHSCRNTSDHRLFSSTSASCDTGLEHGPRFNPGDSRQTAAHRRPRSSRNGCLLSEKQTERREQPDQAEVGGEDLGSKNELQSGEGSDGEDEELNRNRKTSYVYHQPQTGSLPAAHGDLYLCIPCAEGFPTSEQLIAHVETHAAQELTIKAEERGFMEAEDQDSENLPSQSTREEAPPDHVCSVCGQSYVDPALLRRHERSHWPARPFSCHICGRLFTQRGTMTRHVRGHLGLKPFACEECGMRFTRQYRKMEHMRIHSRATAYECQLCGVKFTQQRSIVSHLKMHPVVS